MSGIFGGGNSSPSASPVTSLRLQTSTRGRPIPLAYGKPRVNPNLVWYGDLVATAHEQSNGGKGGDAGSSTNYTYTAAVIMALCEGAINAIPRVWRQKEVFTGTPASNQIKRVQDEAYWVPAGQVVTVANATSYSANVRVQKDVSLTDSLSVRSNLVEGVDYTRSGGVYTFSIALRYQYVYISYDYVASTSAPQDACAQLGLGMVPGDYVQTQPGWMLTKHPAEALAYRGVAYVAGSTYALSDNADLLNHSFEIDTQFCYSPAIRDANPKDVIADLLTNPHYGAGFPASKLADSTSYSQFCVANNIFISPTYLEQAAVREMLNTLMTITNSGVLYSEGQLKFVPFGDVAATANGVTFTPNTTPVYDLTDDDFLGDAGSDPIRVTRKPTSDAYNCVRIKFYNRDNNYNEEIVEAKDQANIELFGLRAMDVMDIKELCDATAARSVAQLVLQRALYIRNQFEFRLGWSKALLEPMDLVTLTDSAMGMDKTPVRILTIEEDEWGELTVTAEEFPLNVCNAATYATQPPVGYAANFNVAPGNANPPVIFEPPIELASSNDFLDIWIAAGGGANYGGCEIWLSTDDATYKRAGKLNGKSRYGTTTAALALQASSGVAAQTLSVSLSSGGQLLSGTLSDATLLNTLCYVGGEFVAYQTATLTGASTYDLTTINRGAYGSGQPAHGVGESFVRIDEEVAKIPLTKDYIGKTLYVKLLAFNQFGGALQALADVAPYSYLVTGRFLQMPPDNVPWFSIEGNTLTWGAVSNLDLAGYRLRFHYGLNRSWGDANPLHGGLISNGPYTPDALPQGQITLMIKAVDMFGNESAEQAVIQTKFGDVIVDNVVESIDFKALGYPGTLTGCSIVSGILKADTTSLFYGNDTADFYGDYDSLPFYIDAYSAMVYQTPIITPTAAAVDSGMTLDVLLAGEAQFIEYRVSGANAMFSPVDTEDFYAADGSAPFYGPEGVYQPWPGRITAGNLQYQFRFSIGQGATQGTIDACANTIDVPDVTESLNDIVIAAAGTRLPITKKYSHIKNIQLTLQADGGTARTAVIIDKNAVLGPLIKCEDASGAYVQGLIDAVPQGY